MSTIVMGTGGTGGHIFPAEALGKELIAQGYNIIFIGGGLETNRYFHRNCFEYHEVASSRFSKRHFFRFCIQTIQGILQAFKLLTQIKPKLVIGFGSFYAFPVLAAAKLKKIPILLFEPNAIPGKVNRLFSKWACLSAVQFADAGKYLQGATSLAKMPILKNSEISVGAAREYFYLQPDVFTFLVFGGSQGADSINQVFSEAACRLEGEFQVIHVTGQTESAEQLRRFYATSGIRACVKAFEERIDLAWIAAEGAVCRAGAATIAEQILYAVPAILVPFPLSAEDHQTHNAQFVETQIKGAFVCAESILTVEHLTSLLTKLLASDQREKMRAAIAAFHQDQQSLSTIAVQLIGNLCHTTS